MASALPVNRLALRISTVVACVVFLSALAVVALLPTPRLAIVVSMALISGVVAYLMVYTLVAQRIELARETLRDAQQGRFESLSVLRRDCPRDELDELVHQAYQTGRTLQQEIERLVRLENYRREYLGDVSHELRTPIFAISGFAETLLDGALKDQKVRRRFMEKIEANARRLEALTRDLAEISRIETGELKMSMKPFDLKPVIRETVESLDTVARDRQIELTIQVPASLLRVVGNRERIWQVVANLIENAIRYNEPGGRVEVILRSKPDDKIHVSVVDDGIGISPESIPRLTDRFFRVDKSRSREQGGTGLGLAIVKHILEALGERLEIESRADYGSKFAFKLPVEYEPQNS